MSGISGSVNGTGRLTNAGRNFVHLFSRSPAYLDLLARARREDRRLSLIEHDTQSLWCPVSWYDDWRSESNRPRVVAGAEKAGGP
jgi:hypothetical protein